MVLLSLGLGAGGRTGGLAGLGLLGGGLVKLFRGGLHCFVELVAGLANLVGVGAGEGFAGLLHGVLDLGLGRAVELVAVVLDEFFGAIDHAVGLVAGFDFLALGLVFLGVRLGVPAHLFDLLFGQAAAGGDGDLLFLAGAQVLGADVEDAVGVDVKGHFDLRHAAWRRRNVREVKFADGLVVAAELAFALQHVDLDAGLAVARGGEDFRLARRDGGVALDEAGEHAAQGFDA